MTKLVSAVRSKGHRIELEGLNVILWIPESADRSTAEQWLRDREQQLRRELVGECQAAAGVRSAFHGSKVVEVRGNDGKRLEGKWEVRAR